MNKFQKVALQIAKDDRKKTNNIFKNESLKNSVRGWYGLFKCNKIKWTYQKALDFKEWNKSQEI